MPVGSPRFLSFSLQPRGLIFARSEFPVRVSRVLTRGLRLTTAFNRLPNDEKIEEERYVHYQADLFYPVSIGEVLNSRYRVVCKLGWGTRSTAWLCRNLTDGSYSTVKVCVRQSVWLKAEKDPLNEVKISQHLRESSLKDEEGNAIPIDLSCMRLAHDSFEIAGTKGEKHQCLVHEVRGSSAFAYRDSFLGGVYPYEYMQYMILRLIVALYCLHAAGIVHTDVSPSNILEGIDDGISLSEVDKDEFARPAPCKILEDRTVYRSRRLPFAPGAQVLCDFGEALIGSKFTHRAMPDPYRAPEVVMEMEWNAQVDVWSIAMTAVGILEPYELLDPRDRQGNYNVILHLRQMHDLMGPPPVKFLQRSKYCEIYWDENGVWKHPQMTDAVFESLESRITRLDGDRKHHFVAFLRRVMKWLPEERPTAEQLLEDEWFLELHKDLAADSGAHEETFV